VPSDWAGLFPEVCTSQLDEKAIRSVRKYTNEHLEVKGFTVTPAKCDFLIALHVEKQTKIDVDELGYSDFRYSARGTISKSRVYGYEEGTLILDFVDSTRKTLIWRGSATSAIGPDATSEEREKRISEAVSKMLENFPPVQ
jgi:hypothetical protein